MGLRTSDDDEKKPLDEKPEETANLSPEDIDAIVKKLRSDKDYGKNQTDTILMEMLREMKSNTEKSGTMRGIRSYKEEEIDINDYLKDPAIFYCYSFSHSCLGDTRFGKSVDTPYGRPIKFKPLYRYVKPGSSRYNQEIVSMSCVKIMSVKEAEWIRSHSLFGIKYFENIKGAANVDRNFADQLVDASNQLNAMSQFEVINRARMENVEISPDIDDVKKRLTYHLAEKAMKNPQPGRVQPIDPNWDSSRIEEVLEDHGDVEIT